MSSEISNDDKALSLDNHLRELRLQRARVRPVVAFLTGILFVILGVLLHGTFGIFLVVLGVAGLLVGVTALAKRTALDRAIAELQKQIEAS